MRDRMPENICHIERVRKRGEFTVRRYAMFFNTIPGGGASEEAGGKIIIFHAEWIVGGASEGGHKWGGTSEGTAVWHAVGICKKIFYLNNVELQNTRSNKKTFGKACHCFAALFPHTGVRSILKMANFKLPGKTPQTVWWAELGKGRSIVRKW